ncbi:MAG: CDP-alcohol phosphatidyltransferase family protein [Lentisphaeraceae bacterium]|nr:CDP-alcohol phosphatidyltransferase family protein [Lentisphaeraceae bacterium]
MALKISTYQLKSGFQRLLSPCCSALIKWRISANFITLFAMVSCIAYAWGLFLEQRILLILFPFFLLFRMILNALDGMVAVKTKTQSRLGMVLNEAGDIISDTALFLSFLAFLPSLKAFVLVLTLGSIFIEILSLVILYKKGIRPFSGPFGKSDRAVFMGILALCIYFASPIQVFSSLLIVSFILMATTIYNRLQVKAAA